MHQLNMAKCHACVSVLLKENIFLNEVAEIESAIILRKKKHNFMPLFQNSVHALVPGKAPK